jgi:hypothetical protein
VNDWAVYLLFSTTLRFDRNSALILDYDLASGNELPNFAVPLVSGTQTPITGTLNNQYIGTTYEIEF